MSKKIASKWTAGNLVKMWCSDAPPETPSDCDDEFNDESFDTSKWTEYDPGNVMAVTEEKYGLKLHEAVPSTVGSDLITGVYQAIPEGSFSISTKLKMNCNKGRFYLSGLMLWENGADSSKKALGLCFYRDHASNRISVEYYSSYNTAVSDYLNLTIGNEVTVIYLRIRRTDNVYYFDISVDGVGFVTVYNMTLSLFTPVHFGLFLDSVNYSGGQPSPVSSIFSFFRYKNSNTGAVPIEGRLLDIKTLE